MERQCRGLTLKGKQCSRFTKDEYCQSHKVKKFRKGKESLGEKTIRLCLRKNKIKFEKQKIIDHNIIIDPIISSKYSISNNLKYYRYDFFLPQYNILIEFDGDQHFNYTPLFHRTKDEYITRRIIDHVKTNQLPSNMKLIRIDYKYLNHLDTILIPYINQIKEYTGKYVLCSDINIYSWLKLDIHDLIS